MSSVLASPAASLLLAAMAAISLWAFYRAPQWLDRGVLRPYWLLRRRQWGTVLSHAFLHADLTHLIFNGFSFWAFAPGWSGPWARRCSCCSTRWACWPARWAPG
jgi:membrane associated rhomboid family serine protease